MQTTAMILRLGNMVVLCRCKVRQAIGQRAEFYRYRGHNRTGTKERRVLTVPATEKAFTASFIYLLHVNCCAGSKESPASIAG